MIILSDQNTEIYNDKFINCTYLPELSSLYEDINKGENYDNTILSSYKKLNYLKDKLLLNNIFFSIRIKKFYFDIYKDLTFHVIIDTRKNYKRISTTKFCIQDNETNSFKYVRIGDIDRFVNKDGIINFSYMLLDKMLFNIISISNNKKHYNEHSVNINYIGTTKYHGIILMFLETFEKFCYYNPIYVRSFNHGDLLHKIMFLLN